MDSLAQQLDALLAKAVKEPAKAAALLDAAPEALKSSGLWHHARGAVALKAGALPAAVKHFEQAVALEADVPEFAANLGAALLEQAKAGDQAALTRALQVLTGAAKSRPKLPDAHTNLGMARLLSGDAHGAIEAFDRALQMEPTHVPALYDKAAALNTLGELDECLRVLDQALKVDPTFEPAKLSRQHTLQRLGRS